MTERMILKKKTLAKVREENAKGLGKKKAEAQKKKKANKLKKEKAL